MACYFTFLLDVDAPLSCGRPGCEFFEDSIPDGWCEVLDGCPSCGYGAASEEELEEACHASYMTNYCFYCHTFYGGEDCPKCYADSIQQGDESRIEHESRLQIEQINFENKRRAGIEEDIPF